MLLWSSHHGSLDWLHLGQNLCQPRGFELAALTYPPGLDVAGGDATPVDEAASDPPSPKEIADETTLDELAKEAVAKPELRSTVYWTNYTISRGHGAWRMSSG